MMIARFCIDARFGHKQAVIDSMKQWMKEIGSQIGWSEDKVRLMTGSVGARESTVVSEIMVEDLSELGKSFEKLATIDAHKRWGKEIEPYIVSGTPRWEIYRVL